MEELRYNMSTKSDPRVWVQRERKALYGLYS